MNNDVIKKWCVFGTSRDKRMAGDFNSRHEAQAWAGQYKGCVVAEVVYDFRNWEPVSEEHPLTQADNGRAVRVNGLEAGVIEDDYIGDGDCLYVKCDKTIADYSYGSITHVARPPKPPRKTIDWTRNGNWFIGRLDGNLIATVVDADQPKSVVATAKFEHKTYSFTCLTVYRGKEWCERVVNGDEA